MNPTVLSLSGGGCCRSVVEAAVTRNLFKSVNISLQSECQTSVIVRVVIAVH